MCLMAANRPKSISWNTLQPSEAVYETINIIEKYYKGRYQAGEVKWSQLLCPLVQIHQHIKVKLCSSPSLSFFVHPLVVKCNIFNRPHQDYIINTTLASLCFISLSQTQGTGILMRTASIPFDETQLVNEWKLSSSTLLLFTL